MQGGGGLVPALNARFQPEAVHGGHADFRFLFAIFDVHILYLAADILGTFRAP